MNDALLERLLYEEEGPVLDFKKEQYRFVKATDEDKSELLKDILGFANAWHRSEAYILIGVEDVRGGRSIVAGIPASEHLDDHSLQQFVNNLTNRPIRFHYEAFGFKGKQVGIIRIEDQARPLYLKKDYGKLKKGEVYVRRGSSTDPTKPADPDELARMGIGPAAAVSEARLAVEFADPDRELPLGATLEWSAELCQMPERKQIPSFRGRSIQVRLPNSQIIDHSFLHHDPLANPDYYREAADYIRFRKLTRNVRLVVTNEGETPATDVRLELCNPIGQAVRVFDPSEVPDPPKRHSGFLAPEPLKNLKPNPAWRRAGDVSIENDGHQTKIEIDCGALQPGRRIWSDSFTLGIVESGEFKLAGQLFAANLPRPRQFALSIKAAITTNTMTVDDLISFVKRARRSTDATND